MRVFPGGVLALVLLSAVLVQPAPGQTAQRTPAEFVAQADGICKASNPRNIKLLKRARGQFARGNERAGARTLIRNERFELSYYGRIAALPRPADPTFNGLIDRFLFLQRGQARNRLKLGKAILAGKPDRVVARYDNKAFRMLRKAGKVSERIGFSHC
jgi:hypothetical protein